MEEKIEELYQEYLKSKLDLIFSVTQEKKHNYGDFLSSNEFDDVKFISDDFAIVKKGNQYAIVDNKCNMISEWYDEIIWYKKNDYSEDYGKVVRDGKWNFINRYGQILSDRWFDVLLDGNRGIGVVRIDGEKKRVNIFGQDIFDQIFEVKLLPDNYSMIYLNDGSVNFADPEGQLIFNSWSKDYFYKKTENLMYLNVDDSERCIIFNLDMHNYHVAKSLFGYQCNSSDNDNDKFMLKYTPIRMYGLRYVLCIKVKNDNLFIYDRTNNTYQCLGHLKNIEYDKNLIITSDKIYLMYDNEMFDISEYYNKYLKGKSITVNDGISIINKSEFYLKNSDEIKEILKAEERKKIEEKKRIEEKRIQEELKKKKEEEEKRKAENLKRQSEVIATIVDSFKQLQELGNKTGLTTKIRLENIFIEVDDYKEINPNLVNFLRYIDLSGLSFKNVKMSGIDFRGSNIWLNPQEVYQKDLSGCNFEGLFMDPFTNFRGVDIRGAKFSQDNDPRTFDGKNMTFKDAIYDETTTYNGKSFVDIYGPCKNKSRK